MTGSRTIARPDRCPRRPRRRSHLAWVAALATGILALAAGPASAGFGNPPIVPGPAGGTTASGGQVTAVDLTLTGRGARLKVPPGRHRVSMPVQCWWRPALGPSTDPKAMLAAYDDQSLGQQTWNAFSGAGWALITVPMSLQAAVNATRADFVTAAAAKPRSLAWYMAVCRDGATRADYASFVTGVAFSQVMGVRYQAFPVGRQPTARPAPADLALYARRALDLPVPVVDHNPKIARLGGASLVGMATWFWVTDPAAVGEPGGTAVVRAQAGSVWAEVTATNLGLTITSAAGRTTCSPRRAATVYLPGTPETGACTLVFGRASVGHPSGWPVTVTSTWHLAWTGSDGSGADLGLQGHTWTTNVPVGEVQTIVSAPGP